MKVLHVGLVDRNLEEQEEAKMNKVYPKGPSPEDLEEKKMRKVYQVDLQDQNLERGKMMMSIHLQDQSLEDQGEMEMKVCLVGRQQETQKE